MMYNENLLKACDTVDRRCCTICDGIHGSSWLYDKLMRFFESEPSAVSVTIPVYINFVGKGTATIGKDGNVVFRCGSEE